MDPEAGQDEGEQNQVMLLSTWCHLGGGALCGELGGSGEIREEVIAAVQT